MKRLASSLLCVFVLVSCKQATVGDAGTESNSVASIQKNHSCEKQAGLSGNPLPGARPTTDLSSGSGEAIGVAVASIQKVMNMINSYPARNETLGDAGFQACAKEAYASGVTPLQGLVTRFQIPASGTAAMKMLLDGMIAQRSVLRVHEICAIEIKRAEGRAVEWIFPNIAHRGEQWLLEVEQMRTNATGQLEFHEIVAEETDITAHVRGASGHFCRISAVRELVVAALGKN